MKEIRIPEDRVGVLIGEDGEAKQEFEELTGCELSLEGNVATVEGDAFEEMTARKIVKAIGRGFSPEKAFKLVERNVDLHVIDVKRYEESQNGQERLKGRVIGRDGEARRHIEKEANIDISVYGSTVSLIGKVQNIEVAVEAVNMLLNGSSHATAYQYLEKNQAKIAR